MDRPTRAQALYQLGVTRLAQGDLREAYEDLKEASRLEPNNLQILLKYEEAYSVTRALLAEEHERTAASSSQSPPRSASSSGTRSSRAKAGNDDLPPTFTFVKEEEQQRTMAAVGSESDNQSKQLQARMFKKGLLDSQPLAPDPTHMADLGYGEDPPLHWQNAPMRASSTEQHEADLGMNMQSPKMLLLTVFCWLVIWLIVTYYYQIHVKQKQHKDVSVPAVVTWSLIVLVLCAAAWRFATHGRVKYVSMSDGIKITCGMIIVIAFVWHKLWQDPEWQAELRSAKSLKATNAGTVATTAVTITS